MWFWLQECLKNGPGGLYNDLTVDVSTVKNIWKSYIWTADKDVSESDPRSNVHYLGSSENKAWKKKKKFQACTGFEPMTSAIPVQRSTNWANKPTGSWSW